MEADDFETEATGFSQPEFLLLAKQMVGAVAQMQLLGRPHGNISPRAFGKKLNGVIKLSGLFDEPCTSRPEAKYWADAYWLQKHPRRWNFKDDALAVGRILLTTMAIGIQGQMETYKQFQKMMNQAKEDLARGAKLEKVKSEQ